MSLEEHVNMAGLVLFDCPHSTSTGIPDCSAWRDWPCFVVCIAQYMLPHRGEVGSVKRAVPCSASHDGDNSRSLTISTAQKRSCTQVPISQLSDRLMNQGRRVC